MTIATQNAGHVQQQQAAKLRLAYAGGVETRAEQQRSETLLGALGHTVSAAMRINQCHMLRKSPE